MDINIDRNFDFWINFHQAKKKPVCVSIREEMLPRLAHLKTQNFLPGFIMEIGIEAIESKLKERKSIT